MVDPPAYASSPYGLLSVVQPRPSGDPHWQNGVTYRQVCPSGGTTYDPCVAVTGTGGAPPDPASKADNVTELWRGATPFTAYTEFDCSPVGLDDPASMAADALARVESWQVERAFWTGTVASASIAFPHLAAGAAILDAQGITLQTAAVTGGGPFDVAEGLGILEAALSDCYNGVGVIHVPTHAVPTLDAWNLLKVDGAQLKTISGNLVAAGAGYTGSSPLGQARPTGQTWLYATGPTFMYRGGVQTFTPPESIDRAANTQRLIAERTYVLGWECCHVAVLVHLGVPVSPSA